MSHPGTQAVLRLTLDTSCVIHAVAGQSYAADVEELANLCRQGRAEMWLRTAFDEDQENAGDARRAANLRWISQLRRRTGIVIETPAAAVLRIRNSPAGPGEHDPAGAGVRG